MTLASLCFLSANSSAMELADRTGGSGVVEGLVLDTCVNVSDVHCIKGFEGLHFVIEESLSLMKLQK